jgi:hypothetical protein
VGDIPRDIHARVPVNKTSQRVVQQDKARYVPAKKLTAVCSELPLPTKSVLAGNLDLRGTTQGHLTVVGLSDEKDGRWVCRCVCGHYVHRTAKSLRNSANASDRCALCQHTAFLRHRSTMQQVYDQPGNSFPPPQK